MNLSIIQQDPFFVAVNKPAGLLVHRSAIDRQASEFALQMVRDQIGQHVYPVHRLDRPTAGVLVFALSSKAARFLSQEFSECRVRKTYLAVVRGILSADVVVDYPLKEELDAKSDVKARVDKMPQSAVTEFSLLGSHEFAVAVDKFATSRYSLVKAVPRTGRKHQIRRHLRHLGHPIVGDVQYGSGKHNRFFRDRLGISGLLLACVKMEFQHPVENRMVQVQAPLPAHFLSLFDQLSWNGVYEE